MSEHIVIDSYRQFDFRRHWGPKPIYHRVERYPYDSPKELIIIAGPCSVEGPEQIHEIAKEVAKAGATHLRGGLFRAGTYPGNTFGWVPEHLIIEYKRAADENNLKTIIEILDYHPDTLRLMAKYADCYQVGARQMQNYLLLKMLGATKRTIFLKRNMGATLDEFLGAAEHLLSGGPCNPILIERGSSTYHNHVRWDLSISIIPAIKKITKIPIIVDASHGTGRRDLVEPMTLAGIAAGANGCLIETHYDPDHSLSDSDQAYPLSELKNLIDKIKKVKEAVN